MKVVPFARSATAIYDEPSVDPTSIRAATYSRYSDDQQRESSIADQQRNCKRRADSEGWMIAYQFADFAISGSDSSRPQYQAMLKSARAGEFQVLIIDDLSRLSRDYIEAEQTIRSLEFRGIRIVSTSEGEEDHARFQEPDERTVLR